MLRSLSSSMRAAANTPAESVGACVARFPTGGSLPRYPGGSASASYPFEACTAFTDVAARMVAKPPLAARYVGVLQTMSLPPPSAPTATGWSDSCRTGFAPAEEWRLSTAHPIRAVTSPLSALVEGLLMKKRRVLSHLQNSNSTSSVKLTDFDSWQFLALIRHRGACGASPRSQSGDDEASWSVNGRTSPVHPRRERAAPVTTG